MPLNVFSYNQLYPKFLTFLVLSLISDFLGKDVVGALKVEIG
jgi:hypothetical protein